MRNVAKAIAVLGLFLIFVSASSANSIPTRSNSNYGASGPYTLVNSFGALTQGTLFVDPTPPTGFMEEVLCPESTGCAVGDSTLPFALLIEPTAPVAGGGFQIDLGSNVGLGGMGITLMTCSDPMIGLNTFCTTTPPSDPCLNEYSSTGNNGDHLLTISYAKDAACIPTPLVFAIDENVAAGSLPTFGTITPLLTTPEPASLMLLGSGLLSLAGFYGRRRRAQRA
jgi:hypothetical protein